MFAYSRNKYACSNTAEGILFFLKRFCFGRDKNEVIVL